jgi:hypothetical protein
MGQNTQPAIHEEVYIDTPKLKITSGWLCFDDTALMLKDITEVQVLSERYELPGEHLILFGAIGAIGALLLHLESPWAVLPVLGACLYGCGLLWYTQLCVYSLHVKAHGRSYKVHETRLDGRSSRVLNILIGAMSQDKDYERYLGENELGRCVKQRPKKEG